jgi:hypothetical protein
MSIASRADLLAASGKRRFGELLLPVSGLTVRYRNLSELELAEFEMESLVAGDDGLESDPEAVKFARARLIVKCLVDEQGHQLLTPADLDFVNELDSDDTATLYDTLREFVGLARRVREARAKQEQAKKNSGSTDGGDSLLSSPRISAG